MKNFCAWCKKHKSNDAGKYIVLANKQVKFRCGVCEENRKLAKGDK